MEDDVEVTDEQEVNQDGIELEQKLKEWNEQLKIKKINPLSHLLSPLLFSVCVCVCFLVTCVRVFWFWVS